MVTPVASDDVPTRQRILDAALELFARQGFAATSVRQLARAVGLRESSLYNHFPGKAAIFQALVETRGPANAAERLRSAKYQALTDSPAGFCATYAADLLEQWCDPRERMFEELLLAERDRLSAEPTQGLEAQLAEEAELVGEHFRALQQAGRIAAPNADETARLFLAGLAFIRQAHIVLPASPSSRAQIREAVVRFLGNFLALIAPAKADAERT